jgi:hypothetical protein
MKNSFLVLAVLASSAVMQNDCRAGFIFKFREVDKQTVVIEASGSVNLGNSTPDTNLPDFRPNGQMDSYDNDPTFGTVLRLRIGNSTEQDTQRRYSVNWVQPTGKTSPFTNFGPAPTASSGPQFGFTWWEKIQSVPYNNVIHVPKGYISDTPLASTSTISNLTNGLADFGLELNESQSYSFVIGSAAPQTVQILAVPEPQSIFALLPFTLALLFFRAGRSV